MATIDRQHCTSDKCPGITCQQQQGTIEVLRRAASFQRDPPDQGFPGISCEKISIHISGDISRGKGVNPDPVTRAFKRLDFRQMRHCRLAGSIGRRAANRPQPRD